MGGRGSGGWRPGSGAKPEERFDDSPFPEVPAPADLADDARAVWERLAPVALERRTLTRATAEDFSQLCKAIVFTDKLEAKVVADDFETSKVTLQMDEKGGGLQNVEKKKHHLLSELRGWRQFVSGRLASFRLSAMGKAIALPTAEQPKNALETLRALRAVK
jgi:hypothetical protein